MSSAVVEDPAVPDVPAPAPEVVAPAVPPSVLRPTDGFTYVAVPFSARVVRNAGRVLLLVAVATICELGAFGGRYLLHDRFYVSTDNAQVDGDQIKINAPSSGMLVRWDASEGSSFRRGEVLGRVAGVGGGPQANRVIKAPGDGVIGLAAVADGTYVRAGQTLAVAYDPAGVYLTARVAESDIRQVRVGDEAEVRLDAFPRTPVAGVVEQLQQSAAGNFTIYPSTDVDPTNIQKVDQYIAVRIKLYPSGGVRLYPGLNAEVHIRVN